jgi:hypothetical protein
VKIALLIGILLPAIGKARDQARLTLSQTNLRNMGQAHGTYAAEWNDRQLTLIRDDISQYGSQMFAAFSGYHAQSGGCGTPYAGGCHPGLILGWGKTEEQYNSQGNLFGYWMNIQGNFGMVVPFTFAQNFYGNFGSFRIPNCRQFSQYLNGRFYDEIFYAPKDTIVYGAVEPCLQDPGEFSALCHGQSPTATPYWPSYCLAASAMFSPSVFRNPTVGDLTGYQDPWSLNAGFRSPAMSQARYPELKTHMSEHHWLQQTRAECNPGFEGGLYDDCEPYYFNLAFESVPMTLFYDGHVQGLGVREARSADRKAIAQSGYGLWSRDTPNGNDGYYQDLSYDNPSGPDPVNGGTSFHVFTMDGILGRDKLK